MPSLSNKSRRSGFGPFRMGCQAYTFNQLTVVEAIDKTAAAGGQVIEFFPGQRLGDLGPGGIGPENGPDVIDKIKDTCQKKGLTPVAFGVAGLGRDAAANRRLFEFAKRLGIGTITSEPDVSALDDIEALVKEFDIRVAIHNHPKQARNPNYRFWDPKWVLEQVEKRDKRIGSCADVGHWVRSGVVPVDAIRILKSRVLSSHLKDLHEAGPGGHDVPYGTGVSNIAGVLDELYRLKFDGHLAVEYERGGNGPLEEVAQCIGFVRGWAAGKGLKG